MKNRNNVGRGFSPPFPRAHLPPRGGGLKPRPTFASGAHAIPTFPLRAVQQLVRAQQQELRLLEGAGGGADAEGGREADLLAVVLERPGLEGPAQLLRRLGRALEG